MRDKGKSRTKTDRNRAHSDDGAISTKIDDAQLSQKSTEQAATSQKILDSNNTDCITYSSPMLYRQTVLPVIVHATKRID